MNHGGPASLGFAWNTFWGARVGLVSRSWKLGTKFFEWQKYPNFGAVLGKIVDAGYHLLSELCYLVICKPVEVEKPATFALFKDLFTFWTEACSNTLQNLALCYGPAESSLQVQNCYSKCILSQQLIVYFCMFVSWDQAIIITKTLHDRITCLKCSLFQ